MDNLVTRDKNIAIFIKTPIKRGLLKWLTDLEESMKIKIPVTKISDKALGISFPFENLYEITTYLESRKLKNTKDFLVITIA